MTLQSDGPALLARAWVMAALVLGIGAFGLTGPHSHAQPPKDKSKEGQAARRQARAAPQRREAGLPGLHPPGPGELHHHLPDRHGGAGRQDVAERLQARPQRLPAGERQPAPRRRPGQPAVPVFGGAGGRIQEFSWDGELLWDFTYADDSHLGHHDICRLPNGNVLLLVWEQKTREEAVAAGRRPETVNKAGLVADSVVEIKPTGKTTGKVVWEWHAWDHLVQEFDKTKDHFDDVGKHPQRIDVNFGENTIGAMVAKPEELKKLQALGYVGSTDRKPGPISPDWLHLNAVAYNAELDQIMLSVHQFSEIWVIDHSTTTAEAADGQGRQVRQGRRPALPLGQPPRLPGRHRQGSETVLPAQRPLDRQGPPRRGQHPRLQQRHAPHRRGVLLGGRDRAAGRWQGAVRVHRGQALRPGRAGVELLGAEEDGLLLLVHLRRPSPAQRQHVHLFRGQRDDLRGDGQEGNGLEVPQPGAGHPVAGVIPRAEAGPDWCRPGSTAGWS